MSDDKNFGASLWRQHTTTALSAQARDGARASFGEALHARHMQFSQMLMRRAGGREQGAGVQRTFVVARRVASASGSGGDDASASSVADGAGEVATSAASDVAVPSMHEGSAAARRDARSAKDERAVSKHLADAAAVAVRRARESGGDAAHDSDPAASHEVAACGAEVSDRHASGYAHPASARVMSGSLVPRVPVSSSGPMPSAGMVMRSAPETHSIKRASPAPLAAALAPATGIGSPIVLHAAHDLSRRASAPEQTCVEISPDMDVRYDAVSAAADSFIDRQMQCGPTMPDGAPDVETHGATNRLPDAQVMRQVATKVTHELPIALLMPHAASYAILPESGGTLARASTGGAPVEGAVRSAQRSGASVERAAPPFAAHPLARAVLSAAGFPHPVAVGPLSPMPMVSQQALSSFSAPSASVDRGGRAHEAVAATNHTAHRAASKILTTDPGAPSSHAQKPTTLHVTRSGAEPMPSYAALALRRAVVAATSVPDVSSASNASSGSSARSRASEASLSRTSIVSAAHTAMMPTPLARAFERSDRLEAPQGAAIARLEPKAFPVRDAVVSHRSQSIEPPAAASSIMKRTPLSSAIRFAADSSRQPHPSTHVHDTPWRPSSAIGRFADIDRETRVRPTHVTAMPTSAVDGQTRRPSAHETTHPARAINGQMQLPLTYTTATGASATGLETPPPLTRTKSTGANATCRETHPSPTHATATGTNATVRETPPPLTHAEATDASAIDHERQPPRPAASSPDIASRAIQPKPVDGASPRETAMNRAQRTPATSLSVKPQAAVRQTARLPLRLARQPRDPRETCSDGVPVAAWAEHGIPPASPASEPAVIDRAAEQYGVISPVTHVTRDAGAPVTASTPPPTASATADTRSTAPAGSAANAGADASELAEQAWQLILDKLAIEQERRGYTSWA
ncbi:hypothetical protein BH160DRAFT_6400 [Burkholderia sp. H160]|nr:hypothetical protein BH160DRAFT_6400 [Burkholderia sp. H160]